jgi:HEAT repeat protein
MRSRLFILGTALLILPACAGQRIHKHPRFASEDDAVAYLQEALEADNPDVRREAIVRLARTRYVGHDQAVRGMALVAESDPSSCVRKAAIRGLELSYRPEAFETYLRVLAPADQRDPKVSPPDGQVRSEAANSMLHLVAGGLEPGEQEPEIRSTAIRLLQTDRNRDVRIEAARLLGFLQSTDSLDALIAGLRQRDFGVAYACERSLMRLTGRSHEYDPEAWSVWREQSSDPFADAGLLDDELEGRDKSWWRRSWDSTRRVVASFMPKKH